MGFFDDDQGHDHGLTHNPELNARLHSISVTCEFGPLLDEDQNFRWCSVHDQLGYANEEDCADVQVANAWKMWWAHPVASTMYNLLQIASLWLSIRLASKKWRKR